MAGSMDSPTPILNEVAEIEGSVVGHLSLEPRGRGQSKKSEHVAGLGMLILKGYRGIGIGTAMMEYAIKWAKDKGFEKISLSAFSTNEPAINLYKKFRFEVEGIKKKEFKIDGEYVDEVCMGLLLR
jgi:RimJ/RimL family protein N-acetyltransferase